MVAQPVPSRPPALRVLSAREASIATALIEAVVGPAEGMPPVEQTGAVGFLDGYLAASPRLNRVVLRGALAAFELGALPRHRHTMRGLEPRARVAYLEALASSPAGLAAGAITALAKLAYYGDDALLTRLGYDAAARVRRGRELRIAEGRW